MEPILRRKRSSRRLPKRLLGFVQEELDAVASLLSLVVPGQRIRWTTRTTNTHLVLGLVPTRSGTGSLAEVYTVRLHDEKSQRSLGKQQLDHRHSVRLSRRRRNAKMQNGRRKMGVNTTKHKSTAPKRTNEKEKRI